MGWGKEDPKETVQRQITALDKEKCNLDTFSMLCSLETKELSDGNTRFFPH